MVNEPPQAPHVVVLGASREGGTGWGIVEEATRAGARLTIGARSRAGLEDLAARTGATPVACDATVESEVSAFMDAAVDAHGPIAAAILAAGGGLRGYIDDMPDDELRRAFSLNYYAPVYFLRHATRRMRDGAGIVLISSVSATNCWPGYFAYGSAKAAVQMLVKYAALEYAPRGIRVNAVCPGPIDTPAASALLSNPALRDTLLKEVPLGSVSSTREVAQAALWFATAAHSITGESLRIDGGLHLRRPPFPDELDAAVRRSRPG